MNATYKGRSIGVAIVDSGIGVHMDLNPYIRQYNFVGGANPQLNVDGNEIDSYNDDPRSDALGHGTHVAGIISGSGSASSGQHKGVATSATLLSLKVLDDQGRGVTSDAIAAMDWLLSYGSYFNIDVVNMSIGKAVEDWDTVYVSTDQSSFLSSLDVVMDMDRDGNVKCGLSYGF